NVLLNVVSASNAEDPAVLWGFIRNYAPETSPETHPDLDRMVAYAVNYFHDFIKPSKAFRPATETEAVALRDLSDRLAALEPHADAEAIQTVVYEVGKAHPFATLRDWFRALYEVLLGQSQGPRFGSFVALYGNEQTRALIARALDGKLAA